MEGRRERMSNRSGTALVCDVWKIVKKNCLPCLKTGMNKLARVLVDFAEQEDCDMHMLPEDLLKAAKTKGEE